MVGFLVGMDHFPPCVHLVPFYLSGETPCYGSIGVGCIRERRGERLIQCIQRIRRIGSLRRTGRTSSSDRRGAF